MVKSAARADPSLRSVLAALAANSLIAAAKGIAAALTGSSALPPETPHAAGAPPGRSGPLAEALHPAAAAGNEVFLYIAIRRSARAPDPTHPFGYGPER